MRPWYKFNRNRFTRYLQKLYLKSNIIKKNLSIQELYMLTIDSYHTAMHEILFNTAFKYVQTHRSEFTVNFWWKSVPHWSTSITKGPFPLIPKREDTRITRLASSTFEMDWGYENKLLSWEVRWCIVMKTFKNNNKNLFIPSFMQFIPAMYTHHIRYGCSDIGRQKNTRKFVLKNLERIWDFRNAICPNRTAVVRMRKNQSINQ